MVINQYTTSIDVFPFTPFSGEVEVQVWHKNTKTMVSDTVTVTIVGTKVTLPLPDLSTFVADDLDTCLIRVFQNSALYFEYVVTWSDGSTDINNTFKNWNTTGNESPEWLTL